MNEDRIPFLATKGGKTWLIAQSILMERKSANQTRHEYLKSKQPDCVNLLGSETCIRALIYKADKIPSGWRRDAKLMRKYGCDDGCVIVTPNPKSKETYEALTKELRDIPSLPDSNVFSNRIGFHWMLREHRMLWCGFEIIGGDIVVAVPKWTPANPDYDGDCEHKEQFVPPDSVQLKHSEYYALKEKAEAEKLEIAQP